MADFCSTCGTPFDGTRQYCERCGVFLGWKTWAAPLDARVCPTCQAPNAPDRDRCGHCSTSFTSGGDWICGTGALEIERLREASTTGAAANRKPSGPLAEGACATCGHVNGLAEVFCGNCGAFLEWEGAVVAAKPPPPAAPEVPE